MKKEIKGFGNEGKGTPGVTKGNVTTLCAGDVEIKVKKMDNEVLIDVNFKEQKKEGL